MRVIAGVLRRADGLVLIALRPEDKAHGGLWEFPGGKQERAESEIEALTRELHEELGVRVTKALPLIRVLHEYETKTIELVVFDVHQWSGNPEGREGQALRWVKPDQLHNFQFPAANVPVTKVSRFRCARSL